ncbi:MAG: hypothetical protein ACPG32_11605 [Akkermansiaceae bacterium]
MPPQGARSKHSPFSAATCPPYDADRFFYDLLHALSLFITMPNKPQSTDGNLVAGIFALAVMISGLAALVMGFILIMEKYQYLPGSICFVAAALSFSGGLKAITCR